MQYGDLGKFIKEKRKQLGISLNSFAISIGYDKSSLSKMENLKQGIKFESIVKIAKGFSMTAGELLIQYESWCK